MTRNAGGFRHPVWNSQFLIPNYSMIMPKRLLSIVSCLAALCVGLIAQAPDRSHPPALGAAPALHLPTIQKRQLANGLPVWLVELHEVPVVQVNLVIFSGTGDDPSGKFGVSNLTAA